jgi:outer membrane protein
MDVILGDSAWSAQPQQRQPVLEVNLQATRDRFEIGDLTRTDVAQSQSRLALAQGQTRSAEANLIASARTLYPGGRQGSGRISNAPPPLARPSGQRRMRR